MKAAEMFATQGAALAKRIDSIATKAEAQAKAPALATLYSDGLQRVAAGDFTGFAMLGQARAESAGNPFLTAMTEDATKEASRMASMFLDSEISKTRLQAEKERAEMIDRRIEQGRTDSRTAAAENDFRDQTAKVQEKNTEIMNQYNNDVAVEAEAAKLENRPPRPIPKPQLIPMPKRMDSASSANNEAALPMHGDPVVGDQQGGGGLRAGVPANQDPTQLVGGDTFMPGEGAQVAPTPQAPPQMPETAEEMEARTEAGTSEALSQQAPQAKPLVNEKQKVNEIKVGNVQFEFPPIQEKAGNKKTTTLKTKFGNTVYSQDDKKDEDPNKSLQKAVSEISADSTFSNFFASSFAQGKPVEIREEAGPGGKGKIYQPYRVEPTGRLTPMGQMDEDGAEIPGVKLGVSEGTYQSFLKIKSLMEGEMRGKFSAYVAVDESVKEKGRKRAIERAAAGESLQALNNQLKITRTKPITKEEVDKVIDERKKKEETEMERFNSIRRAPSDFTGM